MPTGVFDHIMHDLMCCEIPVGALTSNDLTATSGSTLVLVTY